MRDYLILAVLFISAPLSLISPYYGILMWSWLAYFNPHRYAWGVAHDFPVAIVIAVPTIIGAVFAKKNLNIFCREVVLLCGLWMWFVVTTLYIGTQPQFAGHLKDAQLHLESVSKILLMTFITILLIASRDKLRGLVLVIVISFGLRAMVSAIFFLHTGGQYRIWGPDNTFLGDNNDFALALNMVIPLCFFMARSEAGRWVRVTLIVLLVGIVISVIGTFSRGGLLGLSTVALLLLLKSRQKILGMFALAAALLFTVTFTTSAWQDRMKSFSEGTLDESAQSRLIIWKAGWRLAGDYPITGGGFDVYTDTAVIPQYIEEPYRYIYGQHGPHSIYFQILGEQGFVGLGLFLALMGCCFRTLIRLKRTVKANPALGWAAPYADMLQVSLVAYMANGATLGRCYFDLSYQIIACVIILKLLCTREAVLLLPSENTYAGELVPASA
jgi:probable O-glycosylation ligase (exosortase A-associated)